MPVASVEEYLASVPEGHRRTLEALQSAIRTVVPEAAEVISYGVPTFKLGGRFLVGIGSAKAHCSLYTGAIRSFDSELKDFDTSAGTIRFKPGSPLPVELIERIVRARVAEVEMASKSRRR